MKRFLPLLLILSCEDSDSNSNVEFSDVWVRHRSISRDYYIDELVNATSYNWDGNNCTVNEVSIIQLQDVEPYWDTTYQTQMTYNDFGFLTRTDRNTPIGDIQISIFEYIDKWKLIKQTQIDTLEDTLRVFNYDWDGLTQTFTDCYELYSEGSSYCTDVGSYIEYNAYGKELAEYSATGILKMSKEYLDDGRRLLNSYGYTDDGEISTHWEYTVWNGYDFVALFYTPLSTQIEDPTIPQQKIEGTIDDYYNIIKSNWFTFYNGEFTAQSRTIYTYDYDSPFEQIYP